MKNKRVRQYVRVQNISLQEGWCSDELVDKVVSFVAQNDGQIVDISLYCRGDEYFGGIDSMDVQLWVELPADKMANLIAKYTDSRVQITNY